MNYRVSWSPTALDDIDAIAEYINRDSPAYNRAVVGKLLDTARKLTDFPNAGRVVPDLGDEAIREHFVYSYRLIYRIQDQDVLTDGISWNLCSIKSPTTERQLLASSRVWAINALCGASVGEEES